MTRLKAITKRVLFALACIVGIWAFYYGLPWAIQHIGR
jgi:hypothetical protein